MKKGERLLFIIFLALIVFAVYFKAVNSAGLIFDDKSYIEKAPVFNSNVSVKEVLKTGFDGGQFINHRDSMYYRPFVTLSFYIEKKLIGFNPKTLHLTNVIIYLLGVIIVYLFLLRQNLGQYSAELITLLFALSPINVDNVVWVVSRYDLFLLLFGFLSLYFLDIGIESKKRLYYFLSSLFFVLGMFSKETFLIWFLFLPVYEFIKKRKITFVYHFFNLFIVVMFFVIKNLILKFGTLSVMSGGKFLEYFKIGVYTLGTYFRILIFPVFIPKFYFIDNPNFLHSLFSLLFVSFIIFIAVYSFKQKEFLIPLVLFVVSFTPYLYLVFTNLWPFKISTRYMMIPYLAFLWIVFLLIEKFEWKLKSVVIIILSFLFVFSDLQGISSYRSELEYWENAYMYHPNRSYVIYSLANSYYDRKDLLTSEFYLKKALKYRMKKITAYYVALLFSYIELEKAEYENFKKWLRNIRSLELIVPLPKHEKIKKMFLMSDYYSYVGDFEKMENILLMIKKKAPHRILVYQKLITLYCGTGKWESVRVVKNEMRREFNFSREEEICPPKKVFLKLSLRDKALFFALNKNYKNAFLTIKGVKEKKNSDYFLLMESCLRLNREKELKTVIQDFLTKSKKTYVQSRKLGFFFLKRMYRVKDALFYFKKSLKLNPNQTKLKELVHYLEKLNLD